ncbi:MAG TPA: hypothetical protein VFD32_19625, partial [Dehalococcoidia bacterium]|nr:hypothetical protein [Dehalococcoidia bacterium]
RVFTAQLLWPRRRRELRRAALLAGTNGTSAGGATVPHPGTDGVTGLEPEIGATALHTPDGHGRNGGAGAGGNGHSPKNKVTR